MKSDKTLIVGDVQTLDLLVPIIGESSVSRLDKALQEAFKVDILSDGGVDLWFAQNTARDPLLGQEDSGFVINDTANPFFLAQAVLPDETATNQPLIISSKTLADGLGGGGGLSHIETFGLSSINSFGFTGPLSNLDDALFEKTTASSGESGIGFVKGAEHRIDSLFGIPFENIDFNIAQQNRVEEAVTNTIAPAVTVLTPAVTVLTNNPPLAVDDTNTVNVFLSNEGEGETNTGEGGFFAFADPVSGNILSNDSDPDGDIISLLSVNGQSFPTISATIFNGTWTLTVTDDAGGDVGSIDNGWTLNFSTTNNLNAFTFTNSTFIPINDESTTTSDMIVSGINETITNITLTFHDLNHTFFADLDVSVTLPNGLGTVDLFSDVNGSFEANDLTLIFDNINSSTNVDQLFSLGNPLSGIQTVTPEGSSSLLVTGLTIPGTYGTFNVSPTGNYIYSIDLNNSTLLNASNGDTFTDSIPYVIADTSNATDTGLLSVIIDVNQNVPT